MSSHVPGALVPGTIIGGKYRIDREIASGGQGTVFEATHIHLRQKVAIKCPHLRLTQGTPGAERLLREARAAFRVRSQHVARVIDVDTIDDGLFIVMEYLRGIDLKTLIKSRGPLPCAEAVGLLLQACDGVAEAHELGIVHRDLKPSNLFLEDHPDGPAVVKVLDFGLSKSVATGAAVSSSSDELDLTEPLTLLGSPRYMSPEQARDPRQANERSDIWSLGLILHELLTGQPAFRAPTKADVLALVLLRNPTPVSLLRPDLPAGIERVILRCLQKAPEHRFKSVRDLMSELAPFASIAAPARPTAPSRPRRRGLRHPVALTAAGGMLAAAVLVGWGIRRGDRPARFVPAPVRTAAVASSPPAAVASLPPAIAPVVTPVAPVPPVTAVLPVLPVLPVLAERAPAARSSPEPTVTAALRARGRRHPRAEQQHRATAPPSAPEVDDPLDGRK